MAGMIQISDAPSPRKLLAFVIVLMAALVIGGIFMMIRSHEHEPIPKDLPNQPNVRLDQGPRPATPSLPAQT